MKAISHKGIIKLKTRGFSDIVDITADVEKIAQASGFKEGIVCITSAGATGSITTCEYEPGLVADLKEFFEKIIPEKKEYQHNLRWHDGNGFSHLRASLLGPSLSIPLSDKKLALGTWQQIIFIDFDNRPRDRRLLVQIIGG
jgi:secondary thiamine-phosphate synthase enzyme